MIFVALRMLTGDRAKYIGILIGITIASMLITQQAAVFIGLMSRTFGFISDTSQPDIWVMDPKVRLVDDLKPMQSTELLRVRGTPGVAFAVPLYKGILRARLADGGYQACNVIGLDDASLFGAPPEMVEGKLEDLRQSDAVIVDENSLQPPAGKLVLWPDGPPPLGKPRPLKVGDTLEINDHRARVVGICRCARTFQSQPMVYTTWSRATSFAPSERKNMTFVLAKLSPGADAAKVCANIAANTGMKALTRDQFKEMTYQYYMKYTGIPINFGMVVVLGFLVGAAITGLLFFNFTQENLRHFGSLKAMGTSNLTLLRMILAQAMLVAAIGYGAGVGVASFFGWAARNSELAFRLPWQLLVGTAAAVILISLFAAVISIIRVWRLEPAVVFRS